MIIAGQVAAEFGQDPHRYIDSRARKNHSGWRVVLMAGECCATVRPFFLTNRPRATRPATLSTESDQGTPGSPLPTTLVAAGLAVLLLSVAALVLLRPGNRRIRSARSPRRQSDPQASARLDVRAGGCGFFPCGAGPVLQCINVEEAHPAVTSGQPK